MTESEWEQSHPEQCRSHLEAWTTKQKREDTRLASLQLIIAQSAGVKIAGRRPKLADFLPEYAKPEEEDWIEREMKLAELAKLKNQNGSK